MWKQLKKVFESYMMAAAFAESGEHETALRMVASKKKLRKSSRPRKNNRHESRMRAGQF